MHFEDLTRGVGHGDDHPCHHVDYYAGPEIGADGEDGGEDAHDGYVPAEILGEAGYDTSEHFMAHVAVEPFVDWRRGRCGLTGAVAALWGCFGVGRGGAGRFAAVAGGAVRVFFGEFFGTAHCLDDAVDVVNDDYVGSAGNAFFEVFGDALFDVVDYLVGFVVGESGPELGEVVEEESVGVFVDVEDFAVYVGGEALFHVSL